MYFRLCKNKIRKYEKIFQNLLRMCITVFTSRNVCSLVILNVPKTSKYIMNIYEVSCESCHLNVSWFCVQLQSMRKSLISMLMVSKLYYESFYKVVWRFKFSNMSSMKVVYLWWYIIDFGYHFNRRKSRKGRIICWSIIVSEHGRLIIYSWDHSRPINTFFLSPMK